MFGNKPGCSIKMESTYNAKMKVLDLKYKKWNGYWDENENVLEMCSKVQYIDKIQIFQNKVLYCRNDHFLRDIIQTI